MFCWSLWRSVSFPWFVFVFRRNMPACLPRNVLFSLPYVILTFRWTYLKWHLPVFHGTCYLVCLTWCWPFAERILNDTCQSVCLTCDSSLSVCSDTSLVCVLLHISRLCALTHLMSVCSDTCHVCSDTCHVYVLWHMSYMCPLTQVMSVCSDTCLVCVLWHVSCLFSVTHV